MKQFSTIFFFFIPLVSFLQIYSPAQPQLIMSNEQASSFDSLKPAWFYPGEKMLIAKKFEKMEFGISLPQSLQEKIQAFFNESVRADVKLNPFNRHDISIEVEFLKDERSIHVSHGFYYQEYFKDLEHNTWITDTTSYNFRVRFAPPETGNYTARVVINVKNSDPISRSFDFTVE